jgi:enoyl-[acyl-carrier-protein] reductase (NADH)
MNFENKVVVIRPFETADIVGAVLFLSSDLSRLTTGQTLMVDGGTVML